MIDKTIVWESEPGAADKIAERFTLPVEDNLRAIDADVMFRGRKIYLEATGEHDDAAVFAFRNQLKFVIRHTPATIEDCKAT